MSESIGTVLDAVDEARRQLSRLSVAGARGSAEQACAIARGISADVGDLLSQLDAGSPATHAAARAAVERFDSHALAAAMLEASDASAASIFELIGKGLDKLRGDLVRLGRTTRQPV